MFKAVAIDLDGVLIDSEDVHIRTTQWGFQEYGYSLTEKELEYIVGRHPKEYVPYIVKKNKLNINPEDARLAARELYDKLWDESIQLMPEAKETIDMLKEKGLTLVLATNSDSKIVEKFIEKFSLQGVFSGLVTGDEVTKRKPDPEIYLKAKEILGLPGNQILVVEDSEIGVLAAKNAGLSCVAVPNKYTKDMDFSKADYVVESLKGVVEIAFGQIQKF